MTEPAWHPDPTGRNHYRWWDGTQWTDSVSNHGQVGVDPIQAAAPVQAAALVQAAAAPAPQPLPAAPTAGVGPFVPQASASTPKKSNLWKIVIPVGAAAAVAAVLFLVLGGDDGGGGGRFGVIEAELPRRSSVVSFEYRLRKGEAIRVRAEPDDELDVTIAFLADRATTRRNINVIEDTFSDFITDIENFVTDADDVFSESDLGDLSSLVVLQKNDQDLEGGIEADFFVTLADGTYTLLVSSSDGDSRGKVRLIVEKFPGKVPVDTFEGFSDIDAFFSDEADFFSDEAFFIDPGVFNPRR